MSLVCALSLNVATTAAGQNPPVATLTVYNPNATAVAVTGAQVFAARLGETNQTLPMQQMVLPLGPGQPTTIAAGATQSFGPFPVVIASAAYIGGNNPTVIPPSSFASPINPQRSQTSHYVVMLQAIVNGSDGSVNIASPAPLLFSHGFPPPLGSQGGFLNFAVAQNSAGIVPGWP